MFIKIHFSLNIKNNFINKKQYNQWLVLPNRGLFICDLMCVDCRCLLVKIFSASQSGLCGEHTIVFASQTNLPSNHYIRVVTFDFGEEKNAFVATDDSERVVFIGYDISNQ
jgi:hypothetical protein